MHSPVRVHIRRAGRLSAAPTKASSIVKSEPSDIFGISVILNSLSLSADEEVESFGTKNQFVTASHQPGGEVCMKRSTEDIGNINNVLF